MKFTGKPVFNSSSFQETVVEGGEMYKESRPRKLVLIAYTFGYVPAVPFFVNYK